MTGQHHLEHSNGASTSSSTLNITNLPIEILYKIFRFISFETIAKNRIVCRLFHQIGNSMLNYEFQLMRNLTHHRFQVIKSQMPRRESARRKHPLARESDIIETLHMRLTLLQMTFGKHIERGHCCFFAGEILDEVHRIVRYVKETPCLSRAYKVTDELFDLSTMAMEFFKEKVEPTLPEINYYGIDLPDYTPMLTSSPQTQLTHMDNTPNHMHQSSKSSSKKSKNVDDLIAGPSEETYAMKRKFKQMKNNIKRNGGQIAVIKRDLSSSKRKLNQQQRLINNLRGRVSDYDKKFETTNRKLSAVLEELSKCKTELQYWRSKSPANATPTPTGQKAAACTCDNSPCLVANKNDNHILHLSSDVFQPINDVADFTSPKKCDESSAIRTSKESDDLQNASESSSSNSVRKKLKRKLEYLEDDTVDDRQLKFDIKFLCP